MDDLVRWFGQQLDEDERTARAATPGPWRAGVRSGLDVVDGDGWTVCNASDVDAAHIAAHGPTRVLREIDAKRRIVADAAEYQSGMYGYPEMRDVLRLLALPYAGRPGYRDDWRP